MKASIMTTPGPIEAMNNWVIETPTIEPYRISGIDGGISTPSRPADALSAAV
jgi:hypothetical protein